jgi:rhamnose transport system substrate-binding protein
VENTNSATEGASLSRRTLLKRGSILVGVALAAPTLLAACGDGAGAGATTSAGTGGAATATSTGQLVVKAVKSGPMRRFKFAAQPHIRAVPYFNAVETGWKLAAKDLGVDVEINGPSGKVDTGEQVAELQAWILQGVDGIIVSAADAEALTPSINQAVEAGIVVITLDSDAPGSKRQVFDLQASADALAEAQIVSLAKQMGEKGQWAGIIGNLTQAEKKYEFDVMKQIASERYPKMEFLGLQECKDDVQKSADITQQLIVANPSLGGVISNSGAGLPGACQGIVSAGKSGSIKVTGLAAPSSVVDYVNNGTLPEFFLWDPRHLGYRSIVMAVNLLTGKDIVSGQQLAFYPGEQNAAKVQSSVVVPTSLDVVLGPPLVLNKSNVAEYAAFI